MKVFILGLAESGKTTLAKSLSGGSTTCYISAVDWVKSTFRSARPKEESED